MTVVSVKFSTKAEDAFVGKFAWPTLVLALFVFLIYVTIMGLVLSEQIPLFLGILLASCLYYMGYTVFHEAVHGSISGNNEKLAWIDDVLGYVMGQVLCVSYCAHKKQHLKNHNHRNEPQTRKRATLFQEVSSVAKTQYQNFFTSNWPQSSLKVKRRVILEITFMLASRGFLILYFTTLNAAIFYVASLMLGVLILVILFIWCVHPTNSTETQYQNTVTFLFPESVHWLITRLWVFQNYHIIHHLFPQVPFYKYQDLFHAIEVELTERSTPIIRF